jgi:hypothetical protein
MALSTWVFSSPFTVPNADGTMPSTGVQPVKLVTAVATATVLTVTFQTPQAGPVPTMYPAAYSSDGGTNWVSLGNIAANTGMPVFAPLAPGSTVTATFPIGAGNVVQNGVIGALVRVQSSG